MKPSAPLQFLTGTGSLAVSNGLFRARLTGPAGHSAIVKSATDLQAWTPVHTIALPPTGL